MNTRTKLGMRTVGQMLALLCLSSISHLAGAGTHRRFRPGRWMQ